MAEKKNVTQRKGFKIGEFVVYPAHGVGVVTGIEKHEVAGAELEMFVIHFEQDKLTLRVPTAKVHDVGMRKLSDKVVGKKVMTLLKGKPRVKRTMWSRRAQEYEAKINSGDLSLVAEVVRDLYRGEDQPEQSYSERQLYEAALERMAREIAAINKSTQKEAVDRIIEVLSKSAKALRKAAESAAAKEAEEEGKAA
ncbi:MAG: CarD family transcriptional regulator [bacterium]|nr:CarD family transcriptional regulator [bacterium]